MSLLPIQVQAAGPGAGPRMGAPQQQIVTKCPPFTERTGDKGRPPGALSKRTRGGWRWPGQGRGARGLRRPARGSRERPPMPAVRFTAVGEHAEPTPVREHRCLPEVRAPRNAPAALARAPHSLSMVSEPPRVTPGSSRLYSLQTTLSPSSPNLEVHVHSESPGPCSVAALAGPGRVHAAASPTGPAPGPTTRPEHSDPSCCPPPPVGKARPTVTGAQGD